VFNDFSKVIVRKEVPLTLRVFNDFSKVIVRKEVPLHPKGV
jgi:hypothetical protein